MERINFSGAEGEETVTDHIETPAEPIIEETRPPTDPLATGQTMTANGGYAIPLPRGLTVEGLGGGFF